MNLRDLSEFVAIMSKNPKLQNEFLALAARYGMSFEEDRLSEHELDKVSGGLTASQDSSSAQQDSSSQLGESTSLNLALYMERQQQAMLSLSSTLKKLADTSSSISSNLK